MMRDLIVDEIQNIREELSRKFQFDIRKIFEDVKQKEKKHADKLVNLQGKKVPKKM